MAQSFPGFSPKAITFLRQLEKNNSRDWFQPRKDQFEQLLRQPMLALAGLIANQLRTFAVDHVVEPAKAVNRIYRDVRFSKDKSPYKTNLSAVFSPKGFSKGAGAVYYFSISAKEVMIAGGAYMPEPAELAALRSYIAADAVRFTSVIEDNKMTRIVGPVRGDQLTRPPKGFAADHPAIDLLRRKQFYFCSTLPATAATSPGLEKNLVKQFKAMAPAISLLNHVLMQAEHQQDEPDRPPLRPKPMF